MKKQDLLFLLVIIAIIISSAASYEGNEEQPQKTIAPGYTACLDNELLSRFTSGIDRTKQLLLKEGMCLPTEAIPYEFNVMGSGSYGFRHVEVLLPNGESIEVFLPVEAIL